MKKDTSEFYIFHFKMDVEMKDKLKGLTLYKNAGNLSRLIIRILSMLIPFMEKKHLCREQKGSKYAFVHRDLAVERESTHVYMDDGLYRRLKLMHQDLNCYSMAQLLREFLEFFLIVVDLYGDDYQEALNYLMEKCNAENEKFRFSYKALIQLWKLIRQNSVMIRLLNIYNDKFCPVKIYRL
ncbi:MAG: hypothetical protein JXB88_18200 [Spirochaetales bacterium]|nr:hypothetical protein [Spirochaetales bacterium]